MEGVYTCVRACTKASSLHHHQRRVAKRCSEEAYITTLNIMASNLHSASRSQAGSAVLERPDPDRRTDGGNVQLMEARITELYLSLRALYRSNQELLEALKSNPGDKDFEEAVEENWVTMRKQRELAMELTRDMKNQGADIDMPQDICDMDIPAWRDVPSAQEEKHGTEEQKGGETEEGVYL